MTDVYTLGESARFLSRDLEDVMRLVESGELPHQQGQNGDVLISGRDLTKYAISTFGKPR